MSQKTLVVYAHYSHEGHSGYFLKELESLLKARGVAYELVDLYRLGYDPILQAAEAAPLSDRKLSPETESFQEKIKAADRLVFIYPTWWANMPAILKGFIDKVFSSGFAFRYQGPIPVGLLKGKRAAVFSSSGGPRLLTRLVVGDHALKVLVRDTLRFCGIKARGFSVGSARTLDDRKKKELARTAKRMFRYLYGSSN